MNWRDRYGTDVFLLGELTQRGDFDRLSPRQRKRCRKKENAQAAKINMAAVYEPKRSRIPFRRQPLSIPRLNFLDRLRGRDRRRNQFGHAGNRSRSKQGVARSR